jgi:ferredoxin-NADP reductase
MLLTLSAKTYRADNVWSFHFRPDEPVSWLAGQFVKIRITHSQPDAKGTARWFTIAAAPYEELITITARITSSSFKQALAGLALEASVELLEQPAGDFTWRQSPVHHIFAAQGIGITPFIAIIKDRLHHNLPMSADLIYGHKLGSQPLFATQLKQWAATDPSLRLYFEPGTLTPEQVAERIPDYAKRYVYVSGPKSFVKLCAPPYTLALSQLKQDNFPGYSAAEY